MITISKKPDEKDKQILKLCAEGKTAKQIGYEMNLSSRTVEARIVVMRKYYNCKNTAELLVKTSKLKFQ